jgi:hypothetical protein
MRRPKVILVGKPRYHFRRGVSRLTGRNIFQFGGGLWAGYDQHGNHYRFPEGKHRAIWFLVTGSPGRTG